MDFPAGIDRKASGLRIRITRKGKVIHSEVFPGDFSDRHIKAAVRKRDELKAKFRLGIPLEDGTVWIFRDAAQDYMNNMEAAPSSVQSYKNILRQYWMPRFADLPMSAITQQMIARELKGLKRIGNPTKPLKQKTKKNILITLRAVFDHVGIKPNPCHHKFKKEMEEPIERYTPEERDKLLNALGKIKTEFPDQVVAFFALMFTGFRNGEIMGLEWTDWDGENMLVERQMTRRQI